MTSISVPCPHCGAVLKVRDASRLGRPLKCPKCAQPFVLQALPADEATVPPAKTQPVLRNEATPPGGKGPDVGPATWPTDVPPTGVAETLQAQQARRRRRTLTAAVVTVLALFGAGLVAFSVSRTVPKGSPIEVAGEREGSASSDVAEAPAESDAVEAEPAEPIDLRYVPAGTRIVIHVHPDVFWQPNSRGEEFRFCLGPIGEFLAAQIKELLQREPGELSEALFCLIPNERATPPDLVAVFRLKDEAKKSALLDEIGGRRMESQSGVPYYVRGERAYLIADVQTVAVGPAKLAEEMAAAAADIQPTFAGISELLRMTDRSRPITVMVDPVSARIDAEFLLPSRAIPLLEQTCDWFGPEMEAAVWSLAWRQDEIQSELIVRNQGGLDARILQRQWQKRLDALARDILHAVESLSPQSAGQRKLIGRFPAMVRAYTLATRTEAGSRLVKFSTRLPERAAPNLALGALLTWDESTRASSPAKTPGDDSESVQPRMPPLAERLNRPITVEFKKTPLQAAFETIAAEIGSNAVIDGDGLKLAAYTKNMEQNFVFEQTPAIKVIEAILSQPTYDKMCLVVDEGENAILITTYAVTEQKGLKPHVFGQ